MPVWLKPWHSQYWHRREPHAETTLCGDWKVLHSARTRFCDDDAPGNCPTCQAIIRSLGR